MNLLECYGVGTVTTDKETNTDEIMVHVKSLFPDADGEAVTQAETKTVTVQTPSGDSTSSTTLQGNIVAAKWMPFNTNRITPPDVRKGSKVVVYKFKGQSTYRWTYFGMDGTLRLETVIWAFSASPNVNENSPLTPDNYYMMLISTHQKKIQLITGQGNGEPTKYVLELNTGTGQFSIVDGENNILSLNSMEHAFSFVNDENSFINIEKKNITLSCEDQMILRAAQKILMQCKDLIIKADSSIDVQTKKTTWVSPDFLLKGNVQHEGDYEQKGNFTQIGNYTTKGNVEIAGGFSQSGGTGNVSGGWTIDGINYGGHTHTNGNDGKPTGSVIGI